MRKICLLSALVAILLLTACLPGPTTGNGEGMVITLYGFSIMKEPLEKAIFPAFAAKWRAEHGVNISFITSFAGSETVTNQILQGAPADVAILAISAMPTSSLRAEPQRTNGGRGRTKGSLTRRHLSFLSAKGIRNRSRTFPILLNPAFNSSILTRRVPAEHNGRYLRSMVLSL